MSQIKVGFKARWERRKRLRHEDHEISRQETRSNGPGPLAAYPVHMRHNLPDVSDDWATLIKTHRLQNKMSQQRLADLTKVSRETVSRWETTKQTPENGETVDLVVKALPTLDRETAFRAARLLPADPSDVPDPYAYVRAMGLDPNGRVVRRILSLDLSDRVRMAALRREKELQVLEEQRRLEDLEWRFRRDDGDQQTA